MGNGSGTIIDTTSDVITTTTPLHNLSDYVEARYIKVTITDSFESENEQVATVTDMVYEQTTGITTVTVNAVGPGQAIVHAVAADGAASAQFSLKITGNPVPTTPEIASAQQLGIIQGKLDGSFGINERITREDMAVMLYQVIQHLEHRLYAACSLYPWHARRIFRAEKNCDKSTGCSCDYQIN
jgi:hypothetical protein